MTHRWFFLKDRRSAHGDIRIRLWRIETKKPKVASTSVLTLDDATAPRSSSGKPPPPLRFINFVRLEGLWWWWRLAAERVDRCTTYLTNPGSNPTGSRTIFLFSLNFSLPSTLTRQVTGVFMSSSGSQTNLHQREILSWYVVRAKVAS